jgi:N-ethylmaleimide reductase
MPRTGTCSSSSGTPAARRTASVDPTYWADPEMLVVTPGGFSQPSPHRALETAEIAGIIEQYRAAAANAQRAGFDGVELMAANGHLIDQFLQDNSNNRTDRYGGSIENRTRLLFEVAEALVSVWGPDRVGVRVAPSGTFNGMADSDPRTLFRYVAERLNGRNLAYLHVIEPRIKGGELIAEGMGPIAARELGHIFNGPIIAAGGFEPDTAEAAVASGVASLIAFGRHFIANPDLPKRIELGLPLNRYDRSTFYGFDARGYTDYPPMKRVNWLRGCCLSHGEKVRPGRRLRLGPSSPVFRISRADQTKGSTPCTTRRSRNACRR